MTKNFLLPATLIFLLGATAPVEAQNAKQVTTTTAKSDVKFLEDISINVPPVQVQVSDPKAVFSDLKISNKKNILPEVATAAIENASALQFKYALLLDQEVEEVLNLGLFKVIDEWMGTRYRLGGNSKDGIDCSALMQIFFSSLYGIALPRTAREQYAVSHKISRAELREGDLVFFNTIGGVSHVGMYLQNNKFVHASSGGVMISDLYEDYWVRHFIGVGRVDPVQPATALSSRP
jgi:lipoprotein Spr